MAGKVFLLVGNEEYAQPVEQMCLQSVVPSKFIIGHTYHGSTATRGPSRWVPGMYRGKIWSSRITSSLSWASIALTLLGIMVSLSSFSTPAFQLRILPPENNSMKI